MIKKIDIYIIKKYLVTFIVSIILILMLAVVFDSAERLDMFMGKGEIKPPLKEIVLNYYGNFVLFFANLFTPLFAFISVIFFTSRMASRLEIISILSTGTSYFRLLWPFILGAIIIASFNWISANYIIPQANQDKMNFEKKYFGKHNFSLPNIHRQISDSEYVYVAQFNMNNKSGEKFCYERFDANQIRLKIMCNNIIYDTIQHTWNLNEYIIRDMNGLNEKVRVGNKLDTILNFEPKIFIQDLKIMTTMSNKELNEYIEQEKTKGSKYIVFYELEKHSRNANPFTVIIMTLLGVPIASRKVRGGIGFHLGLGVALAFTYIFLGKIFTAYSASNTLDPILAVWIPNIFYAILAFILIRFAQK